MTRGRVTNRMPAAKLHLQTSSGVTNAPNSRLLTDDQRRTHQQSTAKVPEVHLDQLSQDKTKETVTNTEDTKDTRNEATDEASHTNVKAWRFNFKNF